MPSMSVLAQRIVDSWTGAFYYPGDNELFEYLYDAYCKLDGQDHNFYSVRDEAMEKAEKYCEQNGFERCFTKANDKIKSVNAKTCRKFYTGTCKKTYKKTCEKVYEEAYRKLTHWYKNKYPALEAENSGIDRKVTLENIEEGTYSFDEPLTSAPFRNYLIKGTLFRNSDARSFILHTAVAFLLSPEQLDHLLVAFGFHPLHVRHIHDMAIYTVLQDAAQNWTPEERRWRNPFQAVREVYEAARLLLIQDQAAELRELSEDERTAFQSNSTRVVQQYILKQELSRENLLAYVGRHTEFYNLRHRRLLTEHKRLVNLFSELYVRGAWDGDEPEYSFYEFLTAYCKEFEYKRFNEQIYGYVAKCGRHPTREFMIVLWIYAYSFLFCPEVAVLRDYREIIPFEKMNKSLKMPEESPFADYYNNDSMLLSVLEYLSDALYDRRRETNSLGKDYDGWRDSVSFSGIELVAFINGKLRSYSWHPLDSKNAFDRTVLSLGPLRITVNRDMNCEIQDAFYGNERIEGARNMNVDNVPGPLVIIFKLLQEIKAIGNQFITDSDKVRMPLSCNMYELI